MGMIVIDTETTGFDKSDDELLQISVIDENGNTLFNEYIKPERKTEWPEAEKVNHISPETVKACKGIQEYQEKLQHIFDQADVVIGYNTGFDLGFLETAGIYIKETTTIVDVMREFALIYGEWSERSDHYRWKKLSFCADYYGYDWGNDSAHDSLSDCRATLHCYKELRKDQERIRRGELRTCIVSEAKKRPDEVLFTGLRYLEPQFKAFEDFKDISHDDILLTDIFFLFYRKESGKIPESVLNFLSMDEVNAKRFMLAEISEAEGTDAASDYELLKEHECADRIGRILKISSENKGQIQKLEEEWLREAGLSVDVV